MKSSVLLLDDRMERQWRNRSARAQPHARRDQHGMLSRLITGSRGVGSAFPNCAR